MVMMMMMRWDSSLREESLVCCCGCGERLDDVMIFAAEVHA